jgi:mannosyltransferase
VAGLVAGTQASRRASRWPGDRLPYLPGRHRVWTEAAPQDTRSLTDLALTQTPTASNTLAGIELPAHAIPARVLRISRIVTVCVRNYRACAAT